MSHQEQVRSDDYLPSASEEASARHDFLFCFAEPFRILEERGEGRGAFVALSLGLFLCERYFRFKSNSTDLWREEAFLAAAAQHFGVDYRFFHQFWTVYRHGIQYQGSPATDGECDWDINDDYPATPTRALKDGTTIICLNPWKFTEEMIVLCWNDPVVLVKMSNHWDGAGSAVALKWEYVLPTQP